MGTDYKNRGLDFDEITSLDIKDFAAHGGAFPLIVKDVGVVGTITVSGLPQAEDHALIITELQAYLNVAAESKSKR